MNKRPLRPERSALARLSYAPLGERKYSCRPHHGGQRRINARLTPGRRADKQGRFYQFIDALGILPLVAFAVGAFVSQLAANAPVGVRPRR